MQEVTVERIGDFTELTTALLISESNNQLKNQCEVITVRNWWNKE